MKKIIGGKKYDTGTAKKMGSHSYSHPGDFSYFSEELYRKKTGEFFLFGEGGASSKYSKSCGCNTWSGSEEIIPLTELEAKKWAEKHLTADEYEEIFGEVTEEEPTTSAMTVEELLTVMHDDVYLSIEDDDFNVVAANTASLLRELDSIKKLKIQEIYDGIRDNYNCFIVIVKA